MQYLLQSYYSFWHECFNLKESILALGARKKIDLQVVNGLFHFCYWTILWVENVSHCNIENQKPVAENLTSIWCDLSVNWKSTWSA